MRFHVLGIPHTVTNKEYSACAFTQKVLKFCTMMHARGHTIFHYGHERSKVDCTEHVTVTTDEDLKKAYGDYNWKSSTFKHDTKDYAHKIFNVKAALEIVTRKAKGDFLLLFWGIGHAHVAKVHSDLLVVEPGIGSYNQILAPFAIFESYAVMSHVYAKYNMMPRLMDAVVPNYFDAKDFLDAADPEAVRLAIQVADTKTSAYQSATISDVLRCPEGKYALVIARLIPSKGIQLAIESCKEAGVKLIVAGQGNMKDCVPADYQLDLTELDDPTGVTHIGYVEPQERAILIARALCIMCPTLYNEPFGGVNVESQMSGVPVITTDWGGFVETVVHGITGYRCRVLEHFVWALKNVQYLDKSVIKKWASDNYGFDKVASMYEEYFKMIQTVQTGRGFYEKNPGRLGLAWLEKKLPT